ncbi:MAG TPA: hypothetical protein VGG33_08095, partial [Polyangia bacterium]
MGTRLRASFAAALLSAALWGCTSDGRPADAAILDPSFDTNQEVPADVGLTRFLLRNASARSIFIQTSTFSGPGYWGLSRAGTSLPVINT